MQNIFVNSIIFLLLNRLRLQLNLVCSTEYWAGDDIMDSETAAAFELFMAESQQASSSSRSVLPNCQSEVTSGHP